MTARPRRWSLRDRAFAVALLVGAAPFVFLVVLSRIELHEADVSAARAREALGLIRARLDAHRSVEEIEGELRASPSATNLRIRAVDRKGTARFDVNRSVDDTWPYRVGNFFYGPVGPALSSLEAGEGALGARPESAGPTGEDSRFAPGGNALIHVVNQWWHDPLRDEDVQFHVQAYSRRAVLPQFARERQIIKWLSVSLVIALVAGWLLSRQLIRPLEQLRRELLGRAAAAVPKTGLTLDRSDEVGDLANAFNSVLTALAERNKANEAFLTDLAHEFKNPVAAIKTCADLMAGGTLTAERTTKLTEVLHASCAQLDRLVTQFLELSRAEAGLPAEPRELVSVGALVDGLLSTFAKDPRFGSISWRGERPVTSTDRVLGVPSRLERAFSNLLLNALSFAGTTGWVQVDVRPLEAEREIEVVVRDSGPGIAPEQLPRLFERFHTTRGDAKGTGLGLALTRAIVEAHRGRIDVASGDAGGAAFTVRLPLAPSEG